MEQNEVVLSDVHISVPFNTLSEKDSSGCNLYPLFNHAVLDSGVPATLQNLAVSRFNILPTTVSRDTTKGRVLDVRPDLTEEQKPPTFTCQVPEKDQKDDTCNRWLEKDKAENCVKKSQSLTAVVVGEHEEPPGKKRKFSACSRESESCQWTAAVEDEDGDLLVQRPIKADSSTASVITIVHHLATERHNVGHQVWLGALLLCEYILANPTLFSDRVVLDLGAGVGLTSIIAALHAKKVFCTDVHESILDLARYNVTANCQVLGNKEQQAPVRVCCLDWMREFPTKPDGGGSDSCFSWTEKDHQDIQSLQVLMAADVVYDEDLTEGFFRTFHHFMSQPPAKVLYLSLEKRLVFTISDQDVVCPAYDHFRQCLKELDLCTDNGLQYQVEQLSTDFPQCFQYKRISQLEIWRISSTFVT